MTETNSSRTHGLSAYRGGCRCDTCKTARREKGRVDRAKVVSAGGTPKVHGAAGYTNYGCRCDVCAGAAREFGREYRAKNADLLRDSKRKHYLANREHVSSRGKAWRLANPDKIIAARQKRRNADPAAWSAKSQQRVRRYRMNHPDRVHAERAMRRGAESFRILPGEWGRLCARHHHRCAYCGSGGKLTQDHIIPLARGGRHSIGNLIPACGRCNSSKNDRLLVEWKRWLIATERPHNVVSVE